MVEKFRLACPRRFETFSEASLFFLRFCAIVVNCRYDELQDYAAQWEDSQTHRPNKKKKKEDSDEQ